MKATRIIALALVVVMMFACASCTYEVVLHLNVPENTGSSDTGSSNQDYTPAPEVTPTEDTQETPTEGTQEAPTQNNTDTPAQNNGVPSTKAEIVALYNNAYNKLSTASSITRTYDYTSNYNNILDIDGGNSTLAGIANKLMGMFMVENTEAVPMDVNNLPPVGLGTINIDPNNISEATCKDKGDYYEVVLYSTGTAANREVDSQPGKGSVGSFGPLLRAEDVSGAASGFISFEGLHSYYEKASVTAKITKDGKITDLHFETPCILHFDKVTAALVVKVGVCEIGLLFQQTYKIAY